MRLCALDTETTGVDINVDLVTELGFIIWDTKVPKPYRMYTSIISIPHDFKISEEVREINNITRTHIESGVSIEQAIEELNDALVYWEVQALVAHNAPFDRNMLKKRGFDSTLPWFDTQRDIKYPRSFKSQSLVNILGEMGLANPFPHVALFDAAGCMRIINDMIAFGKLREEDIVEAMNSENVTYIVQVGYETKHLAKALGARWEGKDRMWLLETRSCFIDQKKKEAKELGVILVPYRA